jgi:hypothetical protein
LLTIVTHFEIEIERGGVQFFNDKAVSGSLAMTSVKIGCENAN